MLTGGELVFGALMLVAVGYNVLKAFGPSKRRDQKEWNS
jgi:hypothetical protein